MNATAYDYLKKLEHVGFTPAQAEVIIALKEDVHSSIVTKQDQVTLETDLTHKIEQSELRIDNTLKDFKLELLKEFHGLRLDIQETRQEVHAEIQDIRSDMREMRQEMRTETQEIRLETKTEFSEVKADIRVLKGDVKLVKGLAAFITAFVTVIAACSNLFDLSKHFNF